jgi:cathepsin L
MNKIAFLLIALPLCLFAVSLQESFNGWMAFHGKDYKSVYEYNYRMAVYKSNLDFIENHNRQNLGFTVAMNQFGDLTLEEFVQLYLGMKVDATNLAQKNIHSTPDFQAGDNTVDWRTKGAVTPIKDQGQCGSCWAFSTTGSVEGAWFQKKGSLVSLSEQNLVDCSSAQGNMGCDGGLMDSAFDYIIQNAGIDTESSYKYTARDGNCKFNKANVGATMTSYKDVQSKSEPSLTSAITQQPVSVAIDAAHSSFQFYSSGVYYEKQCSSTSLDHGVLAVGYGTQSGSDFYIVKNSWGTSWGNQGYIWMSRNKNNNCGIATMSSYPVV